jgi:ABC-2 type transport system ATP-binding protein
MSVVSLSKLSKSYGSHCALVDVDLDIEQGEVFGYLGPNGAGKTTTIRILLGLLRPSSGSATIFGRDSWMDAVAVHARTGYVPGDPGLWPRLTGEATIGYLARLRRDLGQVARAQGIAERLGLDLTRRVGALSKGNKQKLVIVQAFMGEPDLVVLDEPTTGLDPLVQQEFHAMVRDTTGRGGTVLLSSHLLDDVQRTADRVGIIRDGRLVTVERLEELRAKAVHHVTARFAAAFDPMVLAAVPGVREVRHHQGIVEFRAPETSLDAVVKVLARYRIVDIEITEADLEEMFLAYYAEEPANAA